MNKTRWAWVRSSENLYEFDRGNVFEFAARVERRNDRWGWELSLNWNLVSYGYAATAELAMTACEEFAARMAELLS